MVKPGAQSGSVDKVEKVKTENTDTEQRQKREKKPNTSVEVAIAAGKVIGFLREFMNTKPFKNRPQKAAAISACDELEAALKK